MFELQADKNILEVVSTEPVTSGSVNVYYTHFQLSKDWDGLDRYAVFRGSGVSKTMALDNDGVCVIPWECLVTPGAPLLCGVYGTVGNKVVLPTIWCSLGMILRGVVEGDPSVPPSPDIWQEKLDGKQDKLSGKPGQVVGFDQKGAATPQDPAWMTEEAGDGRYVRLDPLSKTQSVTGDLFVTGALGAKGTSPKVTVDSTHPQAYYTELYPCGFTMGYTPTGGEFVNLQADFELVTPKNGDAYVQLFCGDYAGGHDFVISGLGTPREWSDSANKEYVDNTVQNAVGSIAAALDAINGEVA